MPNLRVPGASDGFLRPKDLSFALIKTGYRSRLEARERTRVPYAPSKTDETLLQ